jgi:hypothetical protein
MTQDEIEQWFKDSDQRAREHAASLRPEELEARCEEYERDVEWIAAALKADTYSPEAHIQEIERRARERQANQGR